MCPPPSRERTSGVAGAAVCSVKIVLALRRILETTAARRAQGDGLAFGQNVVGADVCWGSVDQDFAERARLAAVQAFGRIGEPFSHEDDSDRRLALNGERLLASRKYARSSGRASSSSRSTRIWRRVLPEP